MADKPLSERDRATLVLADLLIRHAALQAKPYDGPLQPIREALDMLGLGRGDIDLTNVQAQMILMAGARKQAKVEPVQRRERKRQTGLGEDMPDVPVPKSEADEKNPVINLSMRASDWKDLQDKVAGWDRFNPYLTDLNTEVTKSNQARSRPMLGEPLLQVVLAELRALRALTVPAQRDDAVGTVTGRTSAATPTVSQTPRRGFSPADAVSSFSRALGGSLDAQAAQTRQNDQSRDNRIDRLRECGLGSEMLQNIRMMWRQLRADDNRQERETRGYEDGSYYCREDGALILSASPNPPRHPHLQAERAREIAAQAERDAGSAPARPQRLMVTEEMRQALLNRITQDNETEAANDSVRVVGQVHDVTLIEVGDRTLGDLLAGGGQLNEEQARLFVELAGDPDSEPVLDDEGQDTGYRRDTATGQVFTAEDEEDNSPQEQPAET